MKNFRLHIIIFAVLAFAALIYSGRDFLFSPKLNSYLNLPDIFKIKGNNKSISLVFAGDVMLARGVDYQMRKNNDWKFPFLKIADYLNQADLVFGNLEGPISEDGENQGSIYSFRADPRAIEGLKFAGFDAMSLANNHILDYGQIALKDTISILKENGIESIGAGRNFNEANLPVIKEVNGVKIAFLAYTNLYPESFAATADSAGISFFNYGNVTKTISDIKNNKEADLVVVFLHWGEEYSKEPSTDQRVIAKKFVDAGADLIIGTHPHVVQEIEKYKNSWIAYSLGNFVFDQNFSDGTMEGLILRVIINDKKLTFVEPIKIEISPFFQPEIMDYNYLMI